MMHVPLWTEFSIVMEKDYCSISTSSLHPFHLYGQDYPLSDPELSRHTPTSGHLTPLFTGRRFRLFRKWDFWKPRVGQTVVKRNAGPVSHFGAPPKSVYCWRLALECLGTRQLSGKPRFVECHRWESRVGVEKNELPDG